MGMDRICAVMDGDVLIFHYRAALLGMLPLIRGRCYQWWVGLSKPGSSKPGTT